MVGSRQAAGRPDWQHITSYSYTQALSRCAWAWEFLRRNGEYQRAWSKTCSTVTTEIRSPNLKFLAAQTSRRDLRQWGVLFQRCTVQHRHHRCRFLVPGSLSACSSRNGLPNRVAP